MFGQTFEFHDLAIVGFLIILEGVLSVDNALVLGVLASQLPKSLQKRALTYGLAGAFVFRFIAIAVAAYLLEWNFAKLLGGVYLIYIAVKHFFFESDENSAEAAATANSNELAASSGGGLNWHFWRTVVVIELTDIAFAVDSILAAIGVLPKNTGEGRHPKLWIVLVGGMLGVVMMRFAAILFIKLLEKFPRFNHAAYLLVVLIGTKLVLEFLARKRYLDEKLIDFHHLHAPAFWVFWGLMVVAFAYGFLPRKPAAVDATVEAKIE